MSLEQVDRILDGLFVALLTAHGFAILEAVLR